MLKDTRPDGAAHEAYPKGSMQLWTAMTGPLQDHMLPNLTPTMLAMLRCTSRSMRELVDMGTGCVADLKLEHAKLLECFYLANEGSRALRSSSCPLSYRSRDTQKLELMALAESVQAMVINIRHGTAMPAAQVTAMHAVQCRSMMLNRLATPPCKADAAEKPELCNGPTARTATMKGCHRSSATAEPRGTRSIFDDA